MNRLSRITGALAGIGVVLAAVSWGYGHASPPPPPRPECPHEWPEGLKMELPVPGPISNVPEFHDCQRFLLNKSGNLAYGSMEAIFVRYKIDSVFDSTEPLHIPDTLYHTSPWYAILTPPTATTHLAIVGQVLSYGNYTLLGIQSTYSCILLEWDAAPSPPMYRAWMVPVPSGTRCGLPPLTLPAAHIKELYVTPVTFANDAPPVSRWDWDPIAREQYIGMVCPTGWCELHAEQGYTTSSSHGGTPSIMKGWYDEQYLASYVSGALTMDGSFGAIFPDPTLGGRSVASYTGQWLASAWVTLNHQSANYAPKLNLEPGSPMMNPLADLVHPDVARQYNEIELCFSTGAKRCPNQDLVKHPCPPDHWTEGTQSYVGTWFARETPVGGHNPTYSCTQFRSYPGFQAPPTVRWRWDLKDETMWISCPLGCCQVKVVQ